jgi:thiol-disulfide isomerase/thioredoxin/Tfp pilus assembly protein PilF
VVTRLCSIAAVVLAFAVQAPPPESPGTPEAKASYDAGIAAVRAGDRATAVTLFRKAIDVDPRYVAAHDEYIDTTLTAAFAYDAEKKAGDEAAQKKATAGLTVLYTGWAAAHPDNAVYEWALAKLAGKDWTGAAAHLERAVAIGPSFARPYQDLSLIAELRGDNRQRIEYLKKAADLNPTDAAYFFYYASATKALDPAASLRLLQQVADKYPGTERAAQGLYWAAYETPVLSEKLAIYDRLRREFPPEKFSWSESGMTDLFDVLAGVDPMKAKALAADMQARITAKSEQKSWQDLGAYAAALAESADLRAKGDGRAAAARLDGVKTLRSYMDQAPLALARAAALDSAGDAAAAYASLSDVTAKTPSDALVGELTRIGALLKKSPEAVQADVRALREAGAKPAPSFTLPDYPGRKDVSLADYKGKVVLINFWYPSCGPCRGEFPTLQRVLDKYKDRGFVILSLNVLPEEKDFVMPYLTKNRFTFRPLETTTEWAEKTYGARGFPTNLLVDGDGRIVFKPGIIRSPREQRTFELQIESLLK